MLDEADDLGLVPERSRAQQLFRDGMAHELAFWSVP
jgi:hypothetical protein